MQIRSDFFLRWKKGTSGVGIETERVEDAGDITGTSWICVDGPEMSTSIGPNNTMFRQARTLVPR